MSMRMIRVWGLVVGIVAGWAGAGLAAEQKVTLMLGGKFCDAYLGDVEAALKRLPAVKAVDFKSLKGHVVVTVDGGAVKSEQLADAVKSAKGEGWHCIGEVMK